ncbi:EAL domain-containing protein [Frateuria sp. Soil773]|uniref:putative bifunctional diguanylate cyclase/phosphodiesterase n=1 Tax=Frateuria sp. Soil773 TaxID=1736407 RepID=UPI002E14BE98
MYALAAVIGLTLALTWGALQIQVALAGFLNGESVWSKAQKQAVIDLDAYAADGRAGDLDNFRRNYAVLGADRWVRDVTASGHYDYAQVAAVLSHGNTIPAAIRGVIFILHHFPDAPYVGDALRAWRSTDAAIAELGTIAGELQRAYAGGAVSGAEVARQRARIHALNSYIEPRAKLFSQAIALGATWMGWVLFACVSVAACLASLVWLLLARRILARIRGTEERYQLLFDSAADAIVMIDEGSERILDANRAAAQLTGSGAAALIGESFSHLLGMSPKQEGPGVLRDVRGRQRAVETQSSLVHWGDRVVRQAIIRDVTERMQLEQERRIGAEALASIAEGVIIADAGRRVVSANAAHNAITGFDGDGLRGRRIDETRCLPDGSSLPASLWQIVAAGGNWQGEVRSCRRDGTSYPERLSISALRDEQGRVQHYVAVITDISTTKANQQRLEYLAAHDPLTGLVNRVEFERSCARAIAAAARDRSALAVLFVDLDAFKVVNDSYSHAIGDLLLSEVAERIRRLVEGRGLVGRIGGDEFTVLLGGLESREQAGLLARQLLTVLSEPLPVGDYEIVLSASIGIAGYPLDGGNPTALIANADAAMYLAKTEERNAFRFYTPMMQADARKRLALVTELRQALARDEFRLVFQPSVELRSGRILAVEALLRWQHPQRGEIHPAEFIPMAEKLGLIRHIDEWVLRTACAQMRRWDAVGLPSIRMAINVSATSYGYPSFVNDIRQALEAMQLAPQRLLLEVTESAILRLGEDTEKTMNALHALGVGVAIDDFGTGYSSMAYLKLPAIAYLKIDQSFVAGLPDNANDAAIVEAMLALSKSLGLCPIAEGIETTAQHEFLLRAGCVEGQGYLYSRPMPPEDVVRLLRPQLRPGPAKLQLVPPSKS